VTVRLARGGRIVNGVGADPDIIAASAKAYLAALNKLQSFDGKLNPQYDDVHAGAEKGPADLSAARRVANG
jgi:hypothetical protein